jgi:hypothetical protein
MSASTNSLADKIMPKPYDNVTKESYGPLANKPITTCDPNMADPMGQLVEDKMRDIFGKIYEPVGGTVVYDETLIKEELQDQFRLIGYHGEAYVKVLDRNENGITFWYSNGVSADEVANAANKFCKRVKKTASFVGAARKCGQPQLVPVKINGQVNYAIPTYAIAVFSCNPFTKPKANKTKA